MRATRLLETATYVALGSTVALWVTLSVFFLSDRLAFCDSKAVMAGTMHPSEQPQCLQPVDFSWTERARLDLASLSLARATADDLGNALLVRGQALYRVRESMSNESFAGVPGESAGPVSFHRLREGQGLASVVAVVSGLLLLILIRRSFAAQKAETCEVVHAMATLALSAKEKTAELQLALTALRLHAAHVEATLEAERMRVAHDLHDGLGSVLTALKFDLSGVAGCAPQVGRKPQVRRASADLVDSAMQSVRRLIATVQPYPLHRAGLWGALVWKADEFEKSLGIACRIKMREDLPWPSRNISLAAFRIVEEALSNVAQHSRATSVDILVQFVAGQLLIEVIDDGCGMPNASASVSTLSYGLAGMRERARAVDGTVTFFARAGHGTIARFTVQDSASDARPAFYDEVS